MAISILFKAPFWMTKCQNVPAKYPNFTLTAGDFLLFHWLTSHTHRHWSEGFPYNGQQEDTLTQSQMLKAPDNSKFIKIQVLEVRDLEKMEDLEYCPMPSLPRSTKLLNLIWSYCQKPHSNGELLKYKSCLCVDGCKQRLWWAAQESSGQLYPSIP